MPTIKYKPTTNGRRGMTVPTFEEITKFSPEKSLVVTKKKHAGRNNYGRITVRHHGGGNRQKYRIIDWRRLEDKKATVVGVEYDPNRSAYIALLQDDAGKKSYIVAPLGVTDGDVLYTVKPGTQTDTRIRLRGKGVPSIHNKNVRGDHYVTLIVQTPTHLNNEAKEALKAFDAACGNEPGAGEKKKKRHGFRKA